MNSSPRFAAHAATATTARIPMMVSKPGQRRRWTTRWRVRQYVRRRVGWRIRWRSWRLSRIKRHLRRPRAPMLTIPGNSAAEAHFATAGSHSASRRVTMKLEKHRINTSYRRKRKVRLHEGEGRSTRGQVGKKNKRDVASSGGAFKPIIQSITTPQRTVRSITLLWWDRCRPRCGCGRLRSRCSLWRCGGVRKRAFARSSR